MTGSLGPPDDPRGFLGEMSRHFPPSAAELKVLDIGGRAAAQLVSLRPDVYVICLDHTSPSRRPKVAPPVQTSHEYVSTERGVLQVCGEESEIPLRDNSIDTVTSVGDYRMLQNQAAFLREALRVLRPGGRLILLDPQTEVRRFRLPRVVFARPRESLELKASVLKDAGFARVLSERMADGTAILSRGEKPYPNLSTAERITRTASSDDSSALQPLDSADLPSIGRGRFVFLLVKQTPDKPPWAIQTGEPIRWDAAMVTDTAASNRPYLLAFTSLPKAVEFMQPAVTAGLLKGVNKVAKFDKSTAPQWTADVLLNPPFESLQRSGRYTFDGAVLPVDPASGVTGEE